MGEIPAISWVMALNMGALITAILVVNNIRDIDSDNLAGRRNIPIIFGLNAALWEYRILVTLPFILLLFTAILSGHFYLLLPLLTIPKVYKLINSLGTLKGKALNSILGGTAQLVLQFGLLLALGFILS
jgi:1,4-dihydroxy-2-naphthoate octaprenyltransferase